MRPLLLGHFAVILFFAVRAFSASEALTANDVAYEDLPRLIKERNENVQAAEASLKASKERSGILTRSFLPQVSGSLGSERFKSGSAPTEQKGYWSVHGRMNLYRGGRDRLENQIRDTKVRRARAEYVSEMQKELMEARQAFWRLLAVSRIIADRKEALEKNESFIIGSRRRAGAGVSTNADTLQFELQKTLLHQDLKKLTLEEDLLRNQLSVALGLEGHKNLRLKGDFQHPSEEISIPEAEPKENLDVQKLSSVHLIDSLEREKASRWWLPKLDLFAEYGVPRLSDEFATAMNRETELIVGVMLTLDLGEGIESRSEASAKGYEALASEKRLAHRLREIRALDHELRHDLTLLHELMHDADRDIEKAEQFLKLTQSEYSRGVKNGPDLLEALQKLYDFRERRTSLYREYHETQAELLALVSRD